MKKTAAVAEEKRRLASHCWCPASLASLASLASWQAGPLASPERTSPASPAKASTSPASQKPGKKYAHYPYNEL